jgi:hypothetical protein
VADDLRQKKKVGLAGTHSPRLENDLAFIEPEGLAEMGFSEVNEAVDAYLITGKRWCRRLLLFDLA